MIKMRDTDKLCRMFFLFDYFLPSSLSKYYLLSGTWIMPVHLVINIEWQNNIMFSDKCDSYVPKKKWKMNKGDDKKQNTFNISF